MALSVETGELVHVLTNSAYLVLLVIVWCCLTAASSIHRQQTIPTFGKLLAALCFGAAAGWLLQEVVTFLYSDTNASVAFLLAFSFLDFAYFIFGFTPNEMQSYMMVKNTARRALLNMELNARQEGMSFREAAWQVAAKANLSKREQEVFMHLIKGDSSQRIAETMVISYHTIRAHTRNIYAKLDIHGHQEMLDMINAVKDESRHDV
jgi:DNA-binding CsgD family transcriptional regulator